MDNFYKNSSSSFGFVEMGSEKEAEEAAKALNGTKLLGRQVGDYHANCETYMNIVTTNSAFYMVTKVPNNDCAQRNTRQYSHH